MFAIQYALNFPVLCTFDVPCDMTDMIYLTAIG